MRVVKDSHWVLHYILRSTSVELYIHLLDTILNWKPLEFSLPDFDIERSLGGVHLRLCTIASYIYKIVLFFAQ